MRRGGRLQGLLSRRKVQLPEQADRRVAAAAQRQSRSGLAGRGGEAADALERAAVRRHRHARCGGGGAGGGGGNGAPPARGGGGGGGGPGAQRAGGGGGRPRRPPRAEGGGGGA